MLYQKMLIRTNANHVVSLLLDTPATIPWSLNDIYFGIMKYDIHSLLLEQYFITHRYCKMIS